LAYSAGQGIFFIFFNEQANPKSPWHDLRVRQALNYAIDRQALSEQQTLGHPRPLAIRCRGPSSLPCHRSLILYNPRKPSSC